MLDAKRCSPPEVASENTEEAPEVATERAEPISEVIELKTVYVVRLTLFGLDCHRRDTLTLLLFSTRQGSYGEEVGVRGEGESREHVLK